jgi:hypothetical protein
MEAESKTQPSIGSLVSLYNEFQQNIDNISSGSII